MYIGHEGITPCPVRQPWWTDVGYLERASEGPNYTGMGTSGKEGPRGPRAGKEKERYKAGFFYSGPGKGRGTGGGEQSRAIALAALPPSPIRLLLALSRGREFGEGARVCSIGVETLGFCSIYLLSLPFDNAAGYRVRGIVAAQGWHIALGEGERG